MVDSFFRALSWEDFSEILEEKNFRNPRTRSTEIWNSESRVEGWAGGGVGAGSGSAVSELFIIGFVVFVIKRCVIVGKWIYIEDLIEGVGIMRVCLSSKFIGGERSLDFSIKLWVVEMRNDIIL